MRSLLALLAASRWPSLPRARWPSSSMWIKQIIVQCHWAGQAVVFPLSVHMYLSDVRTVQWQTVLSISNEAADERWSERTSAHRVCRPSHATRRVQEFSSLLPQNGTISTTQQHCTEAQSSPGTVFQRAHTHTSSCIIPSSRMVAGQVNVRM